MYIAGPQSICEHVAAAFAKGGKYEKDVNTMQTLFGMPWVIWVVDSENDLPAASQDPRIWREVVSSCSLA